MDVDLSGTWRAITADDRLRRSYQSDDFDDRGWEQVPVPGHWQRTSAFATNQSPLLYRARFDEAVDPSAGAACRRRWLTFDGVFYQSDVWLDGAYLGDTEGYFFGHAFEVSDALAERSEHVLGVEVSCTPETHRRRKRNITGVFQDWNAVDPAFNPGGIWQPVRITSTGSVRIARHNVTCTMATDQLAVVRVRCVLDASAASSITIRTTVAGVVVESPHEMQSGDNPTEWTVTIPEPDLWWPHSLGRQPLHEVSVEIVDEHGAVSDSCRRRVGFRSVEMRDWVTSINGERLYLKGTNQGPTDYWLAETTGDDHRRDLQLAVDANLDLVRVHGHIGASGLYDAADELGLLLWQDFPLRSRYHRSIRRQAARQAREAVDLLAHHPSIAIWCARSEPLSISDDGEHVADTRRRSPRTFARAAFDQQLPTYNKSVIDRTVSRAIRRSDGTRPLVRHSGMMPTLPTLDGTDTHLYFGWYHGDERQFPGFCRAMPRMVRFVSEFGAQSVPVDGDFLESHRNNPDWPDLDWPDLAVRHSAQSEFLERYVPPGAFASFDEWAQGTRDYQAMVIRFQVESLRRIKYRPSGGFAQFFLADSAPGITHSIVSHGRQTKAAYTALALACRPVIVIADRLPAHLHGNEVLALDLHVVNDLRSPIGDAELVATLRWTDGQQSHRFAGAVAADSVERIGTIQFVVPPIDGELTLDLELAYPAPPTEPGPPTVARSTYRSQIFHSRHEH